MSAAPEIHIEPGAPEPDWLAVDWGTSHVRAWFLRGRRVVGWATSADGMGTLEPDGFEPALLRLLPMPDARLSVMICGMAGSRQGWIEAPYAATPCVPPTAERAVRAPTRTDRLDVRILPGIKQVDPADVMRGEETQIAGFLALNPGYDGIVCLPGTHSKWVHVSAGEVVSFRTFMTGELFSLLSTQSVLRHSMAVDGLDEDVFLSAMSRGLSRPASLGSDLFALRAEALLNDLPPVVARSRLSGLLVGMELAAAKPYWLGQQVAVLGAKGLANAYRISLEDQGLPVMIADAERMTLEGLKAAYFAEQDADARTGS
ncbi:2-dehydro-3-deoxygalactonokinase [Cognatishimia sp. F0-27]|uniref:2-dehydro-3-deoxygalactonokinase n=1 Tax=Cognatishimia sp. F0-27 TaxID=2816855 RepID=UPI001D0C8228|nr:2-dehydro-3-deoxygalactonokinase [Cognatishimia sp. F0-27]MCC1494847.1 2-dehydro-3-deoxygalactonokinase [Cognatishimia sp. F0-27]